MEELIRYRSFVDELSPKELTLFISKLDKDLIISALFQKFRIQLTKNKEKDVSNITSVIDTLQTIICSRNAIQNDVTSSFTIESLPITIINEVASYSDLKQFTKLERLNRKWFTALRSYPILQVINNKDWIEKYHYSSINSKIRHKWGTLLR